MLFATIVQDVGPYVHPVILRHIHLGAHLRNGASLNLMPAHVLWQSLAIVLERLPHPRRKGKQLVVMLWKLCDCDLLALPLAGELIHVIKHKGAINIVHATHEGVGPVVRHSFD